MAPANKPSNMNKSVTREMGWGNNKEHLNKKTLRHQMADHNGRLVCPNCWNNKNIDIIELRANFHECRVCGFMDDDSMWERKK